MNKVPLRDLRIGECFQVTLVDLETMTPEPTAWEALYMRGDDGIDSDVDNLDEVYMTCLCTGHIGVWEGEDLDIMVTPRPDIVEFLDSLL